MRESRRKQNKRYKKGLKPESRQIYGEVKTKSRKGVEYTHLIPVIMKI